MHDGFAHSAQPVPRPASVASKPPTPIFTRPMPRPRRRICDSAWRLCSTLDDTAVSSFLERHTNKSSELVPARRADRKRRTSPPFPSRSGSPVQFASQVRHARHECTHATVPSVTTNGANPSLTRTEFEFCRQSFKTAFQRCTDIEFVRVSVVISCLLHSFRALHIFEIAAVLVFLLGNESDGRICTESDNETAIRRLQVNCSQIFFIDPAGFVRFAHPLISKFLLSYPIRGIDRSHAVLAKACVKQLELDGGMPEFRSAAELPVAKMSGLSAYAAEHWEEHYRSEEKRNPVVTAQVHRLLWAEVARSAKCIGCGDSEEELRRRSVATVQDYCSVRRFQVLSNSYAQLIVEIGTRESVDSDRCTSSQGSLDQALAELELSENGSDSDNWSLV